MAERRRAGGPLLRRTLSQWRLLAAVLAVTVVGSSLAGMTALLLGPGRVEALEAAAERLDGTGQDLVTVTAGVASASATTAPPSATLAADAVAAVQRAVAPFDATTSVWAASPPLRLPGALVEHTYLLDADTAQAHATLVAGRWPAAGGAEPVEVAVPRTVAGPLGLAVGDRIALSPAESQDGDGRSVVVVGLVDLDASATWQRDPLRGAGLDLGGRIPVRGPLLVAPGTLLEADAPTARLGVEVDVDPTGRPDRLGALAAAVGGLRDELDDVLRGQQRRTDYVTVASGLPGFMADARTSQLQTAGLVLALLLVGLVLTGAAMVLVVRATVAQRETETRLLVDRGAGLRQLAGRAAWEQLVLAVLATAIGVPVAWLAYRALLGVEPLAGAWRVSSTVAGTAGWGWVAAVGGAALLQAVVGTAVGAVPAFGGGVGGAGRRVAAGLTARSGADLLLAVTGVLAVVQLRTHRASTTSVDPVLVLAPALAVLAAAVLALRVLPLVVRLSEHAAHRSTALVVPLAGWQVARGRATTGVLLTVLAAASATFALGAQATWGVSQQAQADARVGSDVRVASDGSIGQGAAILAAAQSLGGPALVAPVTDRTIGLGSRPGGAALLAFDTRQADALVRAPVAGGWSRATHALAPTAAAAPVVVGAVPFGLLVSASTAATVTPGLVVTPTVVLQDELGRTVPLELASVAVDAGPVRLPVPAVGQPALPDGEWRLVAVRLGVTAASSTDGASTELTVSLEVEGAGVEPPATGGADAAQDEAGWTATGIGDLVLGRPHVERSGAHLTSTIDLSLFGLSYAGATLVLTAYPPPEELPVLVSAQLADELGLGPGDVVDLVLGPARLPATVTGVVPYLPARPAEPGVLVDAEALARSLVLADELMPLTDAWWVATEDSGGVAGDAADHAAAIAAATGGVARTGLGDLLASGPLRAAVRAALGLLAVAAVLLVIAGTAVRERAVAAERGLEVARLRGLGVPRRDLLATAVLRHTAITAVGVGLGAGIGWVLVRVLAPALVLAPDGGPVVPAAAGVWPWPLEAPVIAVVLVGCVLVGVPVARRLVGRAAAAVLRSGDAA